MALQEITRKVVSYCEIPDELTEDTWLEEHRCDSYVSHSIDLDLEEVGPLDKWLAETYPELIGIKFLIDMDY